MFKLFLLITGLTLAAARHLPFFRKDYVFFEEFDAFYKIHWDLNGLSWSSAFLACDEEGSKLFYPKAEGEWTIVKDLTSKMSAEPNVTEIFVGIHDEYGLGEFITVDGHSTMSPLSEEPIIAEGHQCVVMDIEYGNYTKDSCMTDLDNLRPFVCKKVDDKPCPTIDRAYEYVKETKKCYKVNDRYKKTWHDAMHTCFMEGGLLAVIENAAEARVVYDRIKADNNENYFTGFRRIFEGGDFYTVKGQKLDTNYELWYNRPNEDRDDCGTIYRYSNTLYTRSQSCEIRLPFICEMAVKA